MNTDMPQGQELMQPHELAPQPVMVSDSASLMSAIALAARDPTVDVTKMERLFAMHKEMQADQARRAYGEAMATCQAELPKIIKDRENKQTDSWYATLDAIVRQIAPVYTKHGFSLSFDTFKSDVEKCIGVSCTVMHAGGHEKVFHYDQPIDDSGIQGAVNKTQTHARGSAITYGRRYLTLMVFNLNTGFDDDGNAASGGGGPPLDDVSVGFIERAANCQHPQEARELRTEVIKHYRSTNKVPGEVMKAINAARDATYPRDAE